LQLAQKGGGEACGGLNPFASMYLNLFNR